MFDIGAIELLLVAAVALIIIGPKDLPIAMRTAGRWLGQLRAMTGHFRVGIDAMIREAEIEEQEKTWADKNAQVMREHPPEKFQDAGDQADTKEQAIAAAKGEDDDSPATTDSAADETADKAAATEPEPPHAPDSPESSGKSPGT